MHEPDPIAHADHNPYFKQVGQESYIFPPLGTSFWIQRAYLENVFHTVWCCGINCGSTERIRFLGASLICSSFTKLTNIKSFGQFTSPYQNANSEHPFEKRGGKTWKLNVSAYAHTHLKRCVIWKWVLYFCIRRCITNMKYLLAI